MTGVVSSAGTAWAATHSSLAYLVLQRQCTDGRAACACLAQPDDSDLLESLRAVRFSHHGDAKDFLTSPVCPPPSHTGRRSMFFSLGLNTPLNVLHCLLWFNVHNCMTNPKVFNYCSNICPQSQILHFAFSIYLFVCMSLVIHDTYTFFTHAAGRIPGKHFNFDLLTFKLCFPPCQPYPVLFQLALHTPFLPFSFCLGFRIKVKPLYP